MDEWLGGDKMRYSGVILFQKKKKVGCRKMKMTRHALLSWTSGSYALDSRPESSEVGVSGKPNNTGQSSYLSSIASLILKHFTIAIGKQQMVE